MKLKTLLLLNERGMSMGYGSMSSNDTKLRATPGGQNDGQPGWNEGVEDWDGIVEGQDWFCYMEGNDWHNKRSGASVYITEDDKPHKMWIKIKTHGLRKNNDTNESFKERVRKHTHKVARTWMTSAKDIHNNAGLNEVGNPINISWKQAFKEALNDPKVKSHIAEVGDEPIKPLVDHMNFTPVKENNMKISYSAVVLNPSDHSKLIEQFKGHKGADWKDFAHHMTICMGELPAAQKQDLGKQINLVAYEIGTSDKAIALKVKGYPSKNPTPHITLFINTMAGGKPVDSNKITVWQPLSETIQLTGIVTEIPSK